MEQIPIDVLPLRERDHIGFRLIFMTWWNFALLCRFNAGFNIFI